jgi:type I restriction enzyme S subunit
MTWTTKKLGDCVDFFNGKAIKATSDERYPVYGSNGKIGFSSNEMYKNSIILGRVGAYCGSVMIEKDKFWASDNTIVVKNNDNSDLTFLYYLFKNINFNQYAGGAAQPLITQSLLKQFGIKLPDLPTQTRIASVLSSYDDLIENNEKRIKALEEIAQLLYTEWFVRFHLPVEVLTKAGFPDGNVKMVESGTEYGEVPEGWEVKKLGDVASIVRGCSYSSEEIDDFIGDYYIVNLKSFNRGSGFRFNGAKYYSGSISKDQSLKTGNIVIAITDMTNDRAVIARPARIPEISGKITFSADVVKIISKILPSSFTYQLLSTYKFTETTKQKANGANVLHLNPTAILEFLSLIPNQKILEQFNLLCSPVENEIDKLINQNQNLSKTRDLLIPQLVTRRRELAFNK